MITKEGIEINIDISELSRSAGTVSAGWSVDTYTIKGQRPLLVGWCLLYNDTIICNISKQQYTDMKNLINTFFQKWGLAEQGLPLKTLQEEHDRVQHIVSEVKKLISTARFKEDAFDAIKKVVQ